MPSSDRRRRSRSRSRSASRSRSPRRDRSRSRSRSGSRSRSRDYKRRRYSHSRSRSRSPRRDSRRRSRSRSPPRKSRTPPRRRSPSPRRRSPSPRRRSPSPPRRPVGPAPPPNYSSSFGSGSSFNAAPSAGAPAFPDGREPSPPPPTVSNGGGIDFDQYENIPVETSGRDCPPPIDSFADCDLGPELMANIVRVNYKKPTPVQKYALPIVLRGRDLMGCAQTGSGKTAAFLFPTLSLLMRGGRPSSGGRAITPSLVVLAPTRELAIQICDEAKKFTHNTWIKVCIVYGGAPMGLQLRELERGCDVIIGTPGRMNDIMTRGRISMSRVKFLILDEADRMLDMGFEPQIRKIVEQSDMPRTGHRRTLMFSATFPKEIQRLAASFLYDYIFLAVGRVGSATDLVKQHFVRVDDSYNGKQTALLQLLKQNSSGGLTLVFTETKRECSSLAHFLYRQGYPATSIHGDRTQAEREDALRSFGSGRTPILVATNVAARGLDINDITHVINYDMPNDIDEYVHRIGRTGRAGKKGLATSLIGRDGTKFGQKLLELLHEGKQEIPEWLVSMAGSFDFRGGGRGKKHNFGGRDFRRKEGFDFSAPHPPASSSSSAYTPVGAAPSYQQPSLQSAVYQPQQQAYPQPNAFAPPQAAAGAWGGYMPQYR